MPQVTSPTARNLQQMFHDLNIALVSDTLDFDILGTHDLDASGLSPCVMADRLCRDEVQYFVWLTVKEALEKAMRHRWTLSHKRKVLKKAFYSLSLKLAEGVKQRVKRPHFAFVDPRIHGNTKTIIDHARYLFQLLVDSGYAWNDIIISIPATEAGIHAAAHLQKVDEVGVNLYLVSNLVHAAACIETGAASISIPIGPLLNAYERRRRKGVSQDLVLQTGIDDIRCILAYLRMNRVATKAIGTEFREMTEIGLLSDFDAVCISSEQIDRLRWSDIPIESSDTASAVNLRASQAQFPTTYLKAGERFMNSMSTNSRKLTNFILEEELIRLDKKMKLIESALSREFHTQIKLHLDGEELYRPLKENLEDFFGVGNWEAETQRPIKKEVSFTTGLRTLQLTELEEEDVF